MAKLVGARVYNSADISITTSGVLQALTFNSERYDTDTIHDTGTNTERLTCNTAGKYSISASILFAANATGVRGMEIHLNGTTVIAKHNQNAASSGATQMSIATIYDLSATDYLELKVIQTSGGSLNITASGNFSPEFMMQRIG